MSIQKYQYSITLYCLFVCKHGTKCFFCISLYLFRFSLSVRFREGTPSTLNVQMPIKHETDFPPVITLTFACMRYLSSPVSTNGNVRDNFFFLTPFPVCVGIYDWLDISHSEALYQENLAQFLCTLAVSENSNVLFYQYYPSCYQRMLLLLLYYANMYLLYMLLFKPVWYLHGFLTRQSLQRLIHLYLWPLLSFVPCL